MTEQVEIQQWRPLIQAGGEGASEFTWGPPDENGLRHPVPTCGPPITSADGQPWPSQWHLDSHVAALGRERDGVERRMEHIRADADRFLLEGPRSGEQRERDLRACEATRDAINAELERLGAGEPIKRARKG